MLGGEAREEKEEETKCKLTATFWADYTRGEQGEFCATSVKRSLESWVVVHLVKENSTPFSADKWTNALFFPSVSMPLMSFIKMGEKMSRCGWKQLTSQGAFDSPSFCSLIRPESVKIKPLLSRCLQHLGYHPFTKRAQDFNGGWNITICRWLHL